MAMGSSGASAFKLLHVSSSDHHNQCPSQLLLFRCSRRRPSSLSTSLGRPPPLRTGGQVACPIIGCLSPKVATNASVNVAAVVTEKKELELNGKRDVTELESQNEMAEVLQETAAQQASAETSTSSMSIADVMSLIKLVDSRDICELELKHLGFEVLIRKKQEVVPLPPTTFFEAPAPPVSSAPAQAYTPLPAATVAPSSSKPAIALLPPPASSDSPAASSPPMLSPMAGTLYRSPAPGEPAFIKVGDKVQKGQIVCIIEAMKLMNEIEVDRTGTVVDILVEDGKPVAVDTPIMVIKP